MAFVLYRQEHWSPERADARMWAQRLEDDLQNMKNMLNLGNPEAAHVYAECAVECAYAAFHYARREQRRIEALNGGIAK